MLTVVSQPLRRHDTVKPIGEDVVRAVVKDHHGRKGVGRVHHVLRVVAHGVIIQPCANLGAFRSDDEVEL